MKLRTMLTMLGGTAAPTYVGAMRLLAPIHRAAWLAAAVKHGVLEAMRLGPRDLDELAEALDAGPQGRELLRAWLRHGCLLGEISEDGDRYRLTGRLAKHMADPAHAELAAFAEALVRIHVPAVYGALDHLRERRASDALDPALVARVAEMLAPALEEAILRQVPIETPTKLLELGAGSARHLRNAATQRPRLEAVGVELDEALVAQGRRELGRAGVSDRARLVQGDLRSLELEATFDVVTLFNLIYYFPPAERADVIARAARWVRPGGVLLLASSCRGGTLANNMMDLWFGSVRGAGPLPERDAVLEALRGAGLAPDAPERILPAEELYLFTARRPA
ncbi:MAG: class I SAM-dependent methyltransferase [Sandaracinaceae bacterium]|nr:class I SAM-dependent methyltransferase [Sandaracinaceae bacterium]